MIVLLLSLSQRGQHLAVRREHISYQQRSRRIKTPSSPNSASLHPSPTTISPRDVDCSRVGQWEALAAASCAHALVSVNLNNCETRCDRPQRRTFVANDATRCKVHAVQCEGSALLMLYP